ncbi:cation diffusion facilitator family transporter [Leucobacter luti]|uniref:Cobalt-zinc-cadmium efflux system protein n=1 Tax=Leucobacter luti TaxID=340320 RepID=A0A4Q7U117_9MICO|nr:cation diffusion facilitator family transporter [Leucobacter luti]MBL3699433.1 cation transporter [Leucobacter luti]RZT66943.1 cobalt-zinc-cadmium efflux system protein [Leucobacter luti]
MNSEADGVRDQACDPEFSAGHPTRPGAAAAGTGHGHDHGLQGASTATGKHRKRLIIVLSITLTVFVVQVIGALISNSLALLADAGHMLTDATGVAIALIASLIATLPATSKRTFGYLRVEVLAALVNGIVLGVIAVVIFIQAIARFGSEVEIQTGPMLVAAIIGGVANLVSLLILQSGQKESLNVRGAYLEVLGDLLGSVAVVVAAVIIMLTDLTIVDQLASILIALLIFPRAISLLREVVDVLLEASPKNIDVDAARDHMLAVPGVAEVHDVHAWTITSGVPAFSAHVTVSDTAWDERGYHAVLDELRACLHEHFDTEHVTLQLEPVSHGDDDEQHR